MMKRIFLLAAVALIGCQACQNNSETEPAEGEQTITFGIVNYEQLTFDGVTRADASSLAHLDMGIYDAATRELVKCEQKTKGQEDYNTFSATLPYGNYIAVFLGYEGTRTADMASPTAIHFPDDFVPYLFCKAVELTVGNATATTQAVALKRAIAGFNLQSGGGLPGNLGKFTFRAEGGGHRLNALTGYADRAENRSYTYNVASYAGRDSVSIEYYTFLTAETAEMDFTVTALDADGGVIRSREFASVPMKINQRTRYSGNFFDAQEETQGFAITLADEGWTILNHTY